MDDKPEEERYQLEEILAFSSKRKRMSVIVKPEVFYKKYVIIDLLKKGGKYVLFCKGADSVVLPKCKES